jgi:hypothetical protein
MTRGDPNGKGPVRIPAKQIRRARDVMCFREGFWAGLKCKPCDLARALMEFLRRRSE